MITKASAVTRNIHFIDEHNDIYCGNDFTPESDKYITVPLGDEAPKDVVIDEHLCGVCWCVYLSLKAEHLSSVQG